MGYNSRGGGGLQGGRGSKRSSQSHSDNRQRKSPPTRLNLHEENYRVHNPRRRYDYGKQADDSPYELDATTDVHGDISMEPPVTAVQDRRMLTRAATKALFQKGAEAWQTLLRPLTNQNPLPVEVATYLTKHFSTPTSHRPAQLRFHGLTIADYARFRDETSCFVCAALCDKIVTKRAEHAVLRPRTPALRIMTAIPPRLGEFLFACPKLTILIDEVNVACSNKDAQHLKNTLIRPDEANSNQAQFLTDLQQELRRTSPANDEGLLLQSLDTLTLAGWLSAKPVIFDYLKLIRDWSEPTTEEKSAQLKKMTDDVSDNLRRLCALMDFETLLRR